MEIDIDATANVIRSDVDLGVVDSYLYPMAKKEKEELTTEQIADQLAEETKKRLEDTAKVNAKLEEASTAHLKAAAQAAAPDDAIKKRQEETDKANAELQKVSDAHLAEVKKLKEQTATAEADFKKRAKETDKENKKLETKDEKKEDPE